MATRTLNSLRPARIKPPFGAFRAIYPPTSRLYSTNTDTAGWDSLETVELAYDLHKEGSCKKDPSTCKSPIVFVHGFFGSKQNNRSISKYAILHHFHNVWVACVLTQASDDYLQT
jgi:pimeloyl-ACP methyl ester carboxylesterase